MMQDPITSSVAIALGLDPESADENPGVASRLAANMLRDLGYRRKYCQSAWNRGMRWYAPNSDVPMDDRCSTTILGAVLAELRR